MTLDRRKRQLDQFSNDPNVTIFVLTVATGAMGINLTAANHVFMMEPPLNPALYLQAINRVYRIGQKKKCHIHTMIMRDSIEQRFWNINKNKLQQNKGDRNLAGNISSDRKGHFQKYEV